MDNPLDWSKAIRLLSSVYDLLYGIFVVMAIKNDPLIWASLRGLAGSGTAKVKHLFGLCKDFGRKVWKWRWFLTDVGCFEMKNAASANQSGLSTNQMFDGFSRYFFHIDHRCNHRGQVNWLTLLGRWTCPYDSWADLRNVSIHTSLSSFNLRFYLYISKR